MAQKKWPPSWAEDATLEASQPLGGSSAAAGADTAGLVAGGARTATGWDGYGWLIHHGAIPLGWKMAIDIMLNNMVYIIYTYIYIIIYIYMCVCVCVFLVGNFHIIGTIKGVFNTLGRWMTLSSGRGTTLKWGFGPKMGVVYVIKWLSKFSRIELVFG